MSIRILETAKAGRPLTPSSGGTYVCVLPNAMSKIRLLQIGRLLGFDLRGDLDELHSTLMYSRGHFPFDDRVDPRLEHPATITDIEFWPGHDNEGYLVLTLESQSLQERHRSWLDQGLVHSFPDYLPHVTLKSSLGVLTDELRSRIKTVRPKVVGLQLVLTNEQIEGLKAKSS